METPQLKHWRTFGPAEWTHVKEGAIGVGLGSLLPVAIFYVAFRTLGFSATTSWIEQSDSQTHSIGIVL